MSLAGGLKTFSATVHKESTNSSCTELENGTCWEQSRRHRCEAIAGEELARTTGSSPQVACLNASRSAAVRKQGRWLCCDTSRFSESVALLQWRGAEEKLPPSDPEPDGHSNTTAIIAVLAAATTSGVAAPSFESCPLHAAALAAGDGGRRIRVPRLRRLRFWRPFYNNRATLHAAPARPLPRPRRPARIRRPHRPPPLPQPAGQALPGLQLRRRSRAP
jgi:hypothetical protein